MVRKVCIILLAVLTIAAISWAGVLGYPNAARKTTQRASDAMEASPGGGGGGSMSSTSGNLVLTPGSAPATDMSSDPAIAPASAPGTTTGHIKGTDLFYGRVNAMPRSGFVGDWSIAGRLVRVTEETKVEEAGESIQVGIRVEVIGVYKEKHFDALLVRNRRR